MRPRGSFGEVAHALRHAAREPGSVRELAQRAGVGYDAARYTASRLIYGGALVVEDSARPMRLVHSDLAGTRCADVTRALGALAGVMQGFCRRAA